MSIIKKDDNGRFSFEIISGTGEITHPSELIFPILKVTIAGEVTLVGAGFFIGPNGLFVTARHVLVDYFVENPERVEEEWVQTDAGFIVQNRGDGSPVRRLIHNASFLRNRSDVSVARLKLAFDLVTKEDILNGRLTVSDRIPEVGEQIFSCAHPKTKISKNQETSVVQISLDTSYYSGKVTEVFPSGRDRHNLPNQCFRTDMHIHPGASGGPVFDEKGHVLGVNSTSLFGETNISYVSSIGDIFNQSIFEVETTPGVVVENISVRHLADIGFVLLANEIG